MEAKLCPLVASGIHEIQIWVYLCYPEIISKRHMCINKRVFKKEYQSKLTKQ